jgi:hypothetical protein
VTSVHPAEPDELVLLIDPRRTSSGRDSDPVDERTVDREDPLLPLGGCWRHAAQLIHEGMVELAEVDIGVESQS